VESTNKVLEGILTKTVQLHQTDWEEKTSRGLVGIQNYMEKCYGYTPYELVYGKQVLLPIEFQIKTFKIAAKLGLNLSEAQQQRILQLNELDEIHQDALQRTILVQTQWKNGMTGL
jgi:hypothetical protein